MRQAAEIILELVTARFERDRAIAKRRCADLAIQNLDADISKLVTELDDTIAYAVVKMHNEVGGG